MFGVWNEAVLNEMPQVSILLVYIITLRIITNDLKEIDVVNAESGADQLLLEYHENIGIGHPTSKLKSKYPIFFSKINVFVI